MAINTYDPANITLILPGIIVDGFARGTFVSVDKSEDTFKKVVGATGQVMRVRERDESGTLTFTLQSDSDSNDLLSALHALDLLTNLGVGPMLLKDMQGASTAASDNCYIVKSPKLEYATDETPVEWVIECPKLVMFVGATR